MAYPMWPMYGHVKDSLELRKQVEQMKKHRTWVETKSSLCGHVLQYGCGRTSHAGFY